MNRKPKAIIHVVAAINTITVTSPYLKHKRYKEEKA